MSGGGHGAEHGHVPEDKRLGTAFNHVASNAWATIKSMADVVKRSVGALFAGAGVLLGVASSAHAAPAAHHDTKPAAAAHAPETEHGAKDAHTKDGHADAPHGNGNGDKDKKKKDEQPHNGGHQDAKPPADAGHH